MWAWLTSHAPAKGFPTRPIAVAYGGDEASESNARTGCIGCPLASKDSALRAVIARPEWSYLSPLTRLKPLYERLSFDHSNRIRKAAGETNKDGSLAKNPQRVGPLTMNARRMGLSTVLDVQREISDSAVKLDMPPIDLINEEERIRIEQLMDANTWPQGWDGTEPDGDALLPKMFNDGTLQPLLLQIGEEA